MNESGIETTAPAPRSVFSARNLDRVCRIAAFGIWGAFIVFCLGLAVSRGLSSADDAYHAVIAKSLARGIGYASTLPAIDQQPKTPVRFDPTVGTGPAVILPCAAVLRIAGNDDVLPGISAILIWAGLLTVLLILLAREVTGCSLLLGTGVFVAAIVLLFADNLFQWCSLLGEVPAMAYLLMGHWLASSEKPSRRSALGAGIVLGLAVQTKYLAALPCLGAFLILTVRTVAARLDKESCGVRLAIFSFGCTTPTLLFELYKLACLGFHGYVLNWRQFLGEMHTMTVDRPTHVSLSVVRERLGIIRGDFSMNLCLWAIAVVVAFCLFGFRSEGRWRCLFAGLLISAGCSFGYWLCFSIGWPRYVIMAVGLACFALSVPVFGLPLVRQKIAYGVMTLIVLSPGFTTIPVLWQRARSDLFHATPARRARRDVVAKIQTLRQQGPINLVSRYWAECADVEFDLDGILNFNQEPVDVPQTPTLGAPVRTIVLVDRRWSASRPGHRIDEHADIENFLGEKIVAILLDEDPYELVEIAGPTTESTVSVVKRSGAYIIATPNPIPPGVGDGAATIRWSTGDGSPGEVVCVIRGRPNQTISHGASGEYVATWIATSVGFEFRLYADKDQKQVLDSVRVIRLRQ